MTLKSIIVFTKEGNKFLAGNASSKAITVMNISYLTNNQKKNVITSMEYYTNTHVTANSLIYYKAEHHQSTVKVTKCP